jgi:hypothetical protein
MQNMAGRAPDCRKVDHLIPLELGGSNNIAIWNRIALG